MKKTSIIQKKFVFLKSFFMYTFVWENLFSLMIMFSYVNIFSVILFKLITFM
jgi:hypothetical protein